jgi:hypothetical protein
MSFYYNIGGPQVGQFEAGFVSENSTYRPIFAAPHYSVTTSSIWRPGYIYLGNYRTYFPVLGRVEFRVSPG